MKRKITVNHILSFASAILGLPATRRRPYEEIEPAVKPVVDSLNAISGVSTVASCEGHFYGGPPYVYFKAPVQTAASIERLLRQAAVNDQPVFQTGWVIYGLFNEKYEQTFYLHSPEYHRRANSPLQAAWLFAVRRRRLNSDLSALAAYLREQTMLLNFGKIGK